MTARLSAADEARLLTWVIAIAALLTNSPGRTEAEEVKFAGGLSVNSRTGAWYSFTLGQGGHSVTIMIATLKHCDRAEAEAWATAWLASHAGTGPVSGIAGDADETGIWASISETIAREVLANVVPLDCAAAGPAVKYLTGRGLRGPWPANLAYLPESKWLEDAHRPGHGALVAELQGNGATMGLLLTWLSVPGGQKSPIEPARQRYMFDDPRRKAAAFEMTVPDDRLMKGGHRPDLVVCEGVEDAMTLAMVGAAPRVLGLPGIGAMQHLNVPNRSRVVVFKDGDKPASAAAKALVRGTDYLLLTGNEVWVTNTPDGADANSILIDGGTETVTKLLAKAGFVVLSARGEAERLSKLPPEEVDREISGVAKRVGASIPTMRRLIRAAMPATERRGKGQVETLLELGATAEYFHDADGDSYADITVNDHRETWPVRSTGFRRWLGHQYFEEAKTAPNNELMLAALNTLEAQGVRAGPARTVHRRVARVLDGQTLYLDLADDNWRAVEITAAGWRVVSDPACRFLRARGARPLPTPVPGGSLDALGRLINLDPYADGFAIVVAFLVTVLAGRAPYPVLAISGESGSTKSSLATTLRHLVDPAEPALRAPPKDARDLIVAATNGHLLVYDNLSGLPRWLSDALCRLSTGGGFGGRRLYTDSEESLFSGERPVILTGVGDVITRQDLAQRGLFVTMAPLADSARLEDAQLRRRVDDARPAILGALLDLVSAGLRDFPATKLARLPRMADFTRWAAACTRELWGEGRFLHAYLGNATQARLDYLENDAVSLALRARMDVRWRDEQLANPGCQSATWRGTASALLEELAPFAPPESHHRRTWPAAAHALSSRLTRAAPALRSVGLSLTFYRMPHTGIRQIECVCSPYDIMPDLASPASSSSPKHEKARKYIKSGDAPAVTDDAPKPPRDKRSVTETTQVPLEKDRYGDALDDGDAKSAMMLEHRAHTIVEPDFPSSAKPNGGNPSDIHSVPRHEQGSLFPDDTERATLTLGPDPLTDAEGHLTPAPPNGALPGDPLVDAVRLAAEAEYGLVSGADREIDRGSGSRRRACIARRGRVPVSAAPGAAVSPAESPVGRPRRPRARPPGSFEATRLLLKEANALGVKVRLSGAGVVFPDLAALPDELRERLMAARPVLWHWLGGAERDAPALALGRALGIEARLVTTRADAREAVHQLEHDKRRSDGVLGVDVETAPKPGLSEHLPWARVNADGGIAAVQPKVTDRSGLSPHLAEIQTLQLYAGGVACFVFRDAALHLLVNSHWLRRQHLVAHNAGFEAAFLKMAAPDYRPPTGRRPRGRLDCTMQSAGLILGIGFGGERRALDNVAAEILDITVPKDLQVSDWAAPTLSPGQVVYASSDAILAHRLHPVLQWELRRTNRLAPYALQRGAIVATAAMELAGLGFDQEEHRRQCADWAAQLEQARAGYTELTGYPPPSTQNETRAWLESILKPEQLAEWPRTEKDGLLAVGTLHLKRLARIEPACRPVLRMRAVEKLLANFGPKLAALVNPATGRLHAHYGIAATKAGRFSCAHPNLQQLPSSKAPEFKQCIRARAGNILVGCDWNQVEMRAAAWLSGDQALGRVYAERRDIHREMAARINRIGLDAVTKIQRQAAKPVSFGSLYGMQAQGLVEYAFGAFDVELTEAEAAAALERFAIEYPTLHQWKWDNYDDCRRLGFVRIGAGRVVMREWEAEGRIRFAQACNLPIQGIAADAMLRAIRLAHARLSTAKVRGGLVASVHDELLVEVDEADADGAAVILQEAMLQAFIETFPGAPTNGVAVTQAGRTWAEAKADPAPSPEPNTDAMDALKGQNP